jgi:hypothetical protein
VLTCSVSGLTWGNDGHAGFDREKIFRSNWWLVAGGGWFWWGICSDVVTPSGVG